ncbi:hypothetical protein AAFF27_25350 [Xylophilus sp. GW821-FHT01B05]
MSVDAMLAALEAWAPVTALRQSAWGYPLASWAHLLGLGLLFGAITVVDLRLAGGLRRLDRAAVLTSLVPLALAGFALAALSGLLLFAPAGREYLANPYFVAKFLCMALAGLNALGLHLALRRSGTGKWLPAFGLASLLLWCAVIFAGRMLAFG